MQSPTLTASTLTNPDNYEKVMGCWLGKAVGGTLGMPFEGVDGPLDLEFYEPVPTEMLPNDDLDLQVVWACALNKLEIPVVDRHILAQAWRDQVTFPWDEYGVALRNMAYGLHPPLTGSYDNWFGNSMGATIRSEIWACLAPGNPKLAAAYAYEDACVDHIDEGIYGETFFAALESMAFVESDTDLLLDGALATLPETSLIRQAIESTRIWWEQTRDWREVRELILRDYGHTNFTDATMNVAFTVLGWLAGEGDFSRSICIAVNCGKDTDCTGATVGALMGIIDPHCIPDHWLAPIGRDLVLSPGIIGLDAPSSLDGFTELVIELRGRLSGQFPAAKVYDQGTEHLKIRASIGFLTEMPMGDSIQETSVATRSIELGGNFGTMPADQFEDDYLYLEFTFEIKEAGPVLALFNTSQNCRVWVDGQFAFERVGERVAPSFHRAPVGRQGIQQVLVDLELGQHVLTAVLQRPQDGEIAEWVVGIGDIETKQWIPGAFQNIR